MAVLIMTVHVMTVPIMIVPLMTIPIVTDSVAMFPIVTVSILKNSSQNAGPRTTFPKSAKSNVPVAIIFIF